MISKVWYNESDGEYTIIVDGRAVVCDRSGTFLCTLLAGEVNGKWMDKNYKVLDSSDLPEWIKRSMNEGA